MKPFFEDPALTLYQGDALAVLQSFPPLCVDAVITDPPYSSGGLMLSARQADPAAKYQNNGTVKTYPPMFGDNRDQRSFIMWATLWLAECWRVARDGSPLLMFSDWRQLPAMTDAVQAAGWTWRGVVVWHKRTGRPLRGEFRREAEFVIFASKGRLGYRGPRCLPGLYAHTVDHGPNVYRSRTFPGLCGDYGPTGGKLRPKRKRRGAIRAFLRPESAPPRKSTHPPRPRAF